MKIKTKIAYAIKKRMITTGITKKDICKEICITQKHFDKVLEGEENLTFNETILICVLLYISPNILFSFDEIDIERTSQEIRNAQRNYKNEKQEDLIIYEDRNNDFFSDHNKYEKYEKKAYEEHKNNNASNNGTINF